MKTEFRVGWVVGVFAIFACLLLCWGTFRAWRVFQNRTTSVPPALTTPQPITPEPIIETATAVAVIATPTIAPTITPLPTPTLLPPLTDAHIKVPYQPTSPQIDGVLDEWQTQQAIAATFITEQQDSWDGSMDVENLWWLGWDETFLYVAVLVRDDVHVQTEGAQFAYFGDSLELQFDTDMGTDRGDTMVNEDDFQFVLSPGNFAAIPAGYWRFVGDDGLQMFTDFAGSTVQVVSQPRGDGYTLEAAIPWSDMAVQPSSTLTIGVALSVNDNDTPGSRKQELMVSHVASRLWIDPTSWGTMTLQAP